MNDLSEFASRLHELCDEQGIPKKYDGRQRVFVERLKAEASIKVSMMAVYKWLAGDGFPKFAFIKKIATWGNVNVEWLITGRGAKYVIMDVYKIRLQNLIDLMGDQKQVVYAAFVGTEAAYLSQILSPNLRGRVGEALARRIEAAHKLRHGWMDVEHSQELSAQARSVAEAVDSQGYPHDAQEQLANYLLNQIIQFRSIRADSAPSSGAP